MEPKPKAGELPFLNVVLTPDEIQVLNECQLNSIFHRGLPLGLALAGGCYYMMSKGMLKKSTTGILSCGLGGFLIGTISYRGICMEKLLTLPNSTFKDKILAARGMQPQVREVNSGDSFFDSILPSSDPPANSSLNIEPYQSREFDNYHDLPPVDAAQRESFTSYDELRRRNRQEYERGNRMSFGPPGSSGPAPQSSSYYSPSAPSNDPISRTPSQSGPFNPSSSYDNRPPAYDRPFDIPTQSPNHGDDY